MSKLSEKERNIISIVAVVIFIVLLIIGAITESDKLGQGVSPRRS